MILKISFFSVAVPTLLISILLILVYIGYKKLIQKLGKGEINKAKYAKLYSIERQPASGNVELFYELEENKDAEIVLLNMQMEELKSIDKRAAKKGGNKVMFDTSSVENGRYFFELRTENQKSAKTLIIQNQHDNLTLKKEWQNN
jgi:hypothetical protein